MKNLINILIIFMFQTTILFSRSLQSPTISIGAKSSAIKFQSIYLEGGQSFQPYMIYEIVRDKTGLIWIATTEGLAKYNGYNLKIYRFEPDNPNSLSSSVVISIRQDRSGALWIATTNGLNKLLPETETFIHFKNDPRDSSSLSSNSISKVFVDRANTLWIGTFDAGLNRFNQEQNNFTRFLHNEDDSLSLSHNCVRALYEDVSGNLWIGTEGGGLNLYEAEYRSKGLSIFTHFKHDLKNRNSISNNNIWDLCGDSTNTLWLATSGGGLNKLNFKIKEDGTKEANFTHYLHDANNPTSISSNAPWSLLIDRFGTLWIGTFDSGLNRFDRATETFTRFKPDASNPSSIKDNVVAVCLEDPLGTIWLGTGNQGVQVVHRNLKLFRQFPISTKEMGVERKAAAYAIHRDKDGLFWIGTHGGGLFCYNKKFNKLTQHTNHSGMPNCNVIYSILEHENGNLLIGTLGSGIYEFNKKNEKFLPYSKNNHRFDRVLSMCKDRFGCLWIATLGNGVKRFDRENKQCVHYLNNPENPNSLGNNVTPVIFEDHLGNIWIGTVSNGINKIEASKITEDLNPNQEIFVRYTSDPNSPNSISSNSVACIYLQNDSVLWIGTYDGGLNQYEFESDRFFHYTVKEGIVSNTIRGIIADQQGNLWISTNYGLSKFVPQSEEFKNYDINDGILANEFCTSSCCRTAEGELFFGGINGFISFYPDQIYNNTFIPPVILTGFNIIGEPAKFDSSISVKKEIALNYTQKVFSFEFAALNYINPQKNQFAYKLEGFDTDWLYNETGRRIRYTNISPGKYVFRVKASNNDGIWNEKGTSIKIVISPPYWRTWWFYSLVGTGFIGLLAWGYFNRVNRLIRQRNAQQAFSNQLIEAGDIEQKRIANELHDSLGQNLLITKNEIEQCLSSSDISTECAENLQQVTKIIAESINEVREISYNLHPHQLDRIGLTKSLQAMITKINTATSLNFNFQIDNIDNLIPVNNEIHIYRIVQEGINNIIKHAQTNTGIIQIKKTVKQIVINIEDNGIGIHLKNADEQIDSNKGFGLSGIAHRTKILCGNFTITSRPGKGVKPKIVIPIEVRKNE